MNEQEFFDLALRVIGGQAGQPERELLEALLASRPELKAEFDQIQADTRLAKRVLPLLAATQSTAGEFPAYARGRLQTKVRETLGRPEPAPRRASWNWRWVLGLAAATTAVLLLLASVFFQPGKPVVQVAMLDTAGAVRGEERDIAVLKRQWTGSDVQTFENASALQSWQANWPRAWAAAKVIYNRPAGEVRVILLVGGKPHEKTFLVNRDLAATLKQASAFIQEQTRR